jgi:hypothetical protein
LKFFTVESVANASDLNINALGMMAGMAPHILRDKARAFLQAAKDTALPQHQAEELAKRDAIIAQLQADMARLASQVNAAPQAAVSVPPPLPVTTAPAAAAPQRKRGRPSKADLAARAAAQGT